MGMTPQEIQEKHFHDTFRGYSHEEVDLFLDEVAVAFERLYRENQSFMRRVVDLEEQVKRVQDSAGNVEPARAQEVYEEDPGVTESTLKRMLLIAQETADRAVQEARQRSREIQEQARARADEMMEHAERRVRELSSQRMEKEKELERAKEALRRFDQQYRASFRVFIESQLEALKDLPATPPVSDMEVDNEPRAAGLGSRSELPGLRPAAPGPVGMETVAMPVQQAEQELPLDVPAEAQVVESVEPMVETQEPAAPIEVEPEAAPLEWAGEGAQGDGEPEDDPELVRPRSNLAPEVGPIRAEGEDREDEVVTRNSLQEGPRGRRKEGQPADGKDAEEDRLIRELFWGEDD